MEQGTGDFISFLFTTKRECIALLVLRFYSWPMTKLKSKSWKIKVKKYQELELISLTYPVQLD